MTDQEQIRELISQRNALLEALVLCRKCIPNRMLLVDGAITNLHAEIDAAFAKADFRCTFIKKGKGKSK